MTSPFPEVRAFLAPADGCYPATLGTWDIVAPSPEAIMKGRQSAWVGSQAKSEDRRLPSIKTLLLPASQLMPRRSSYSGQDPWRSMSSRVES